MERPQRFAYLRALGITRYGARRPAASAEGVVATAGAATEPDWERLRAAVTGCRRCGLCATRTQTVFGTGDPRARLVIVGEAPGAEEDRQGEPFVGRAGLLLNSMLRAAGLARGDVFIANVLKCRPPNNRDPQPAEIESCVPYLYQQIELIAPRVILCAGRIAAQNLLGTTAPLGRLRGVAHQHPGGVPVVVTYHPAYLLRAPGEKRKAWADLQLVMSLLEDGDRA